MQCVMLVELNFLLCICHWHEIRNINQILARISKICKRQTYLQLFQQNYMNQFGSVQLFIMVISRIQRRHHLLCSLYHSSFRESWNNILYAFLLISLPFNIMCLLGLINSTGTNEYYNLMCFLIFITHSMIMLSILLILSWQTETLHQSKRYLVPIVQWITMKPYFRLKYCYSDWFNRLLFGTKYGPTITVVGELSYNLVFKVNFELVYSI